MVRFWDTSAIVPLLLEEPASRACRELLRSEPRQIAWVLARTEALSAIARQSREGLIDGRARRAAERKLDALASRWIEIDAVSLVRDIAERLLRAHPLRAADALQLGAALVAVDSRPSRRPFVSRDDALLAAAEREGFDPVLPRG